MLDISTYVGNIREANTGSEMRIPLSRALSAVFNDQKNTELLNYHDETYFAKQSDMAVLTPIDEVPRPGSKKLVTSNSVRLIVGDIEHLYI